LAGGGHGIGSTQAGQHGHPAGAGVGQGLIEGLGACRGQQII
jgi:hypothetical protein